MLQMQTMPSPTLPDIAIKLSSSNDGPEEPTPGPGPQEQSNKGNCSYFGKP